MIGGGIMNIRMSKFKKPFIFFCIGFSLITLVSSIFQLAINQPTDTNLHIVNRAAITLIAVVILTLFDQIKLKNAIVSNIVSYVACMSLVFGYVGLTQFIEPLHPNAYRDIFFNFTLMYIVVAIIQLIKRKNQSKRKKEHNIHLTK